MAHLVFAMSSWNPGGTYDLPLLSVLSDSWTIRKNLTRRNSFIVVWHFFSFRPVIFGLAEFWTKQAAAGGPTRQSPTDGHGAK
jgi:hypothetical protein